MYLIRERFFRLGEDSEITDDQGRPVLHVDGKVLSLRDRLVLRDPEGREVAQVQRKLVALRPTYEITVGGQEVAEVRKHFFTPFGDRFTIDIPGPGDLEMAGNLFDHEFTVRRGGQTVATVSKRWFSLRDTYAVDVAPGEDDLVILASVLALDLAADRVGRAARGRARCHSARGPGFPHPDVGRGHAAIRQAHRSRRDLLPVLEGGRAAEGLRALDDLDPALGRPRRPRSLLAVVGDPRPGAVLEADDGQ